MEKPVFERSSGVPLQERQSMRFSDEVSTAEVVRLLERLRHEPPCAGSDNAHHGEEIEECNELDELDDFGTSTK